MPVSREHAEACQPLLVDAAQGLHDYIEGAGFLLPIDPKDLTVAALLRLHPCFIVDCLAEIIEGTEDAEEGTDLRSLAIRRLRAMHNELGAIITGLAQTPTGKSVPCKDCEILGDSVCIDCGTALVPTGYCGKCDEYKYA
jgi:hypothetical protein